MQYKQAMFLITTVVKPLTTVVKTNGVKSVWDPW